MDEMHIRWATGLPADGKTIMATMNISLPDELKTFVDAQVTEHGYGSTSEYLRDLIRKQRDVEQLRQLLLEGASAGPGRLVDDTFFADLRAVATGHREA